MPVDCDKLWIDNVISRATNKKLYEKMHLKTLYICQSKILKYIQVTLERQEMKEKRRKGEQTTKIK